MQKNLVVDTIPLTFMRLELQVSRLIYMIIFSCHYTYHIIIISEFVPQAPELIPKNDEEPIKIVFLLTLNGRAIRQVYRLLKSLYNRNHYYYIHVDSVSTI